MFTPTLASLFRMTREMRITTRKMSTPIQEELDNNIKVRSGMVKVSDGKTRPTPMRLQLSMELLKLQKEEVTPPNQNNKPSPSDSRVRIVGITRQKVGGLGLSIKGGSEHKLPILVSRIFKDQAADQTGQLFVGDAIIKVNGELITHCQHDEAVNILRNAGDIVMLTVKHYRAATPFLQKARIRNLSPSLMIRQTFSNTPSPVKRFSRSAGDDDVQTDDNFSSVDQISYEDLINIDCDYSVYSDSTLAEEDCRSDDGDDNFEIYYEKQWYYVEKEERELDNGSLLDDAEGWKCNGSANNSLDSRKMTTNTRWVDIITVPLMMAYVTRYIFGTDKLRPNAFEVRGLNGASTGVVHCDEAAILSQWLKYITDNIMGLTHLQMKLYNRNFPAAERIEYMGWVNEGVLNNNQPWQNYRPRFLTLKGTDVMLFDSPPLNVGDWAECSLVFKVYQSMLRVIKDSENVDERQHCFLIQTSGQESRYFSVETRQELLRIESSWHSSVCSAVIKIGNKSFNVSTGGKPCSLTLDWNMGFTVNDTARTFTWQYKFSQLRGSSDDGKSKLKLHFQDAETKGIETKELECSNLQALLFCMHAFLTAKVASVDPAFLSSRTP